MTFADVLKAIKSDFNASQEEMAEVIGTTQKTMSNWLNGRNEPNKALMKEIIAKLYRHYSETRKLRLEGSESYKKDLASVDLSSMVEVIDEPEKKAVKDEPAQYTANDPNEPLSKKYPHITRFLTEWYANFLRTGYQSAQTEERRQEIIKAIKTLHPGDIGEAIVKMCQDESIK